MSEGGPATTGPLDLLSPLLLGDAIAQEISLTPSHRQRRNYSVITRSVDKNSYLLTKAATTISQTQADLQSTLEMGRILIEKNHSLTEELNNLELSFGERVEEENEQLRAYISELTEHNQKLEHACSELRAEKNQLNLDNLRLQGEIERLHDDVRFMSQNSNEKKLKSKIEFLEEANASLQRELEDMQTKYHRALREQRSLERQRNAQSHRIEQLEKECLFYRDKVAKLESAALKRGKTNGSEDEEGGGGIGTSASTGIMTRRGTISGTPQQQIQQMALELDILQRELDQMKRERTRLTDRCNEQEQVIADLRKENSERTQMLAKMRSTARQIQWKHEESMSNMQDISTKLLYMRMEKEHLQEEIKLMKNRFISFLEKSAAAILIAGGGGGAVGSTSLTVADPVVVLVDEESSQQPQPQQQQQQQQQQQNSKAPAVVAAPPPPPPPPPIVIEPPLATMRSGYLFKEGAIVKNWRRRWFTFQDKTMCYYKYSQSPKPINSVLLKECRLNPHSTHADFCFELIMPHRTFYLSASNEQEKLAWTGWLEKWLKLL